ncbi:NAD(P)H-dependent oxidoreductase [Ureaplasma zalophigenitalium]|uniref:NAD(P)H-dependent oxidoreductase n=1 Tax=Ureaplasma zalophigenitalium TaxID=907723 RepID=A0ABT3BPL7_9BACT|nr:NAD(P)H-dependent oxidoreductase [Ureaplasma zalophigenitalium]MCV3754194.1 NAD(P)H-dependent oxidoreductase [Ureaplasma zalophigenitalium]
MKKTVVLYARICPDESVHTKYLFEAFQNETNFDTRFLDAAKPFDFEKEKDFIYQYDRIIFLFTINWFNMPWSLSRYFAEVWKTKPFDIAGRDVYKIITTGRSKAHYQREGENASGFSVDDYLNNMNGMLKSVKTNIKETFAYHNCVEYNAKELEEFKDKVIHFFKNLD